MLSDVLNVSLSNLRGVGDHLINILAKLNLFTYGDLLFHFPLRYEDRTRISSIGELKGGDRVLIEGVVERVNVQVRGRGRRALSCCVRDETGLITLRFYHFTKKQVENLQGENIRLRCFGEIREGYRRELEIVHPEYRTGFSVDSLPITQQLTAVYPVTKGISSIVIRKLVQQLWDKVDQQSVEELLSDDVLRMHQWPGLLDTLRYVHAPPVGADVSLLQTGKHPLQKRLAFEELLAHQLSLAQVRARLRAKPAFSLALDSPRVDRLLESLPFTLTQAQQRVWQEIRQDLSASVPALRLVQGDVGSGKTIVSALAMVQGVDASVQVAMMAPTELLAEQHYKNLKQWFEPLGIRTVLLTAGLKTAAKREALEVIASHRIDVVVGTHALFQDQVVFKSLGLLIVDEQHRFGVHQRLALVKKGQTSGKVPHQVIMTATPIPRTLSMSAYGDLDASIIDELPPGRKPIQTCLISQQRRDEVMGKVLQHAMTGQQIYWVCTLVDESEVLEAQAAEVSAQQLQDMLPDLNIGLVHGRMKSEEKEAVMQEFVANRIHVLVATTVIEVGVDVPNATLMIIENPERLGLAQLHQLRGRVGRGAQASFCFLMYKNPLSLTARHRLGIMKESQDGFYIAEQDMLMRGPGEVLGVRQSGLVNLRVADLIRDQELIEEVHELARDYSKHSPGRVQRLLHRWIRHVEQFAHV
jgi:ATP-dependent DNA helicase RecG